MNYNDPNHILLAIEEIESIINIQSDADEVLDKILKKVLMLFSCDRAWLFYPCNPNLPTFKVTYESTTPSFPGAKALNEMVPMTRDMANYCNRALSNIGYPEIDPPLDQKINNDIALKFDVRSIIFMALKPQNDDAWMFGMHHCAIEHNWTDDEIYLFKSIGQRITKSIENLIFIKKITESEQKYRQLFETASDAIYLISENGKIIDANQGACSCLDRKKDEIRQLYIDDVDPNFSVDEFLSFWDNVPFNTPKQFESTHKTKNNDLISVEVIGQKFRIDNATCYYGVARDITERQKAEMALKESEAKYRLIAENMSDVISIMDMNLQFTYVSPSINRLTGFTVEEAIKHSFEEILPPQSLKEILKIIEKEMIAETSGTADPFRTLILEYEQYKKDNTTVWVESNCKFLRDQTLKPNGILIISRDINERKRAEEALLESEEKYRVLFEHTGEALFVAQDGRIVFQNPRSIELSGYSTEEFQSKPFFTFIHEDDREMVADYHIRRLSGEKLPEHYAFRIIHKNGSILWAEINAVLIQWERKPAVLCFMTDITERRQAEESLRVRLSYEQLLSRVSVLAMETEDLYVFQNKCLKAMGETLNVSRIYIFEHHHETDTMDNTFEWVGEGVLPQKDELQGVSAADSPWWMKVLKSNQVINFSDIEDIPDEGAKTILGLQGILSILVVPLFTAGQYYGFLGFDDCIRHREWSESDAEFLQAVGRIMTGAVEQKRAEDEREKLQEQLSQAQKMESVGRLAGGVAHDFNNMLGVILGHTELALLQADENHDLYSDLIEIQKAAKRSANTTKQLLAFARKDIISPRQLDLNDTVESMLNMLRRLIGEDIDLSWLPAKKLWSVKMDPSQIDQILANLCVNARDAISGVGKLTIETGIKTFDEAYCKDNPGFIPGNFVLLAVSDNGCGMDKDTLDNLFEPFFTTKEVGKGTGLGLATIYGIVKQNNGFINVYSESGRGSTFNIYLPRLVDDENTDTDVPENKATAGGTETILLVEDEPTILRMTRMMLERKGYSVLSAATPAEAIDLAKAHADKIHLLMSDVVMPEMNGRDLAGQITALYPEIKLLFMSGYTADVIAHQGILDDGVTFIQKPFSMADMTEKVREVLDIAPDKN